MASGLAGAAILTGAGVAALINHDGSRLPVVQIQNAAASGSTSTTAPSGASDGAGDRRPARPAKLDADTEAKVKAASLAAVPGATFDGARKMMSGEGYKALLTKADGTTHVLVTEDNDFKVTKVEDPAPPRPHGPRGDHMPLDDATAAKVKAAALEAVPGATVDRVGRDRSGDGFVALLTKSDGTTHVLVHEDANYKVTKVEDPAPVPRDGGPGGRGHGFDGPPPDGEPTPN